MGKIQILEKSVANKISAGEVVEKPASVVKELIENSLDAGAKSIIIEIEGGGSKKISVSDNGQGIEKTDVKLAFLPHSTSKIQTADDLHNIETLGFRGEALSSISAVSEVELTTKTENEAVGTKLEISGGEFTSFEDIACNKGTKIIVKNLFFNTPARLKFLRKEKTEENEITKLIEKFLLANPNIKFKYVVDEKIVYNTSGSGCYDNIYTIYGSEIANNLIKISYSNNKFSLEGFIGNPQIAKSNRTYQTLFVNGRIVVNYLISNAIQSAFDSFLMKGKFPFYVLNLTVPFDSVDVNVHPSKQEIKFENTSEIYSFFANSVSEALMSVNHIKNLENFIDNKIEKAETLIEKVENNFNLPKLSDNFGVSYKQSNELKFNSAESMLNEVFIGNNKKDDNFEFENISSIIQKSTIKENEILNFFEGNEANFKIIGTIFSTYIIVEKSNKILMIDQHACHERKIYDNLLSQIGKNELITQELLLPFTFSCNISEHEFFMENIDEFAKIGFEIEDFGNRNLKISRVPFLLQNLNLENFIEEVKSNLTAFNKKTTEILKDFLAKTACKSAVKAGNKLTENEINALLTDLDKHKTLLCPHGRPIVVEITKNQIEKWFKRIV